MKSVHSVLYYDRDPAWREQAARWLARPDEIEIVTAGTFDEAVALFGERPFKLAVASPLEEEVLSLLSFIRPHDRAVPFVLLMEPGHEAVVIKALNSGAERYVEKSGEPAERLGTLARTVENLVVREQESVALQRRNEELEFLSRTAMDFIRMDEETDIYRYIAEKVYELVRERYVALMLLDRDARHCVIQEFVTDEALARIPREELGRDPVGMSFPIDRVPSAEVVIGCGRLVETVTSLYQGLLMMVPKEICDRIEERFDIGRFLTMGFTCRDGLYGALTIAVRKGGELAPRDLVEAFVRQASVALLRQHARRRLNESEARYRAVVESQEELICRFGPDGTHRFANEAYCRYFCLDPATVAGTGFHPDVPEPDRAVRDGHFRGLVPGRPDGTIEHRVRLPDGSVRWLQFHDRVFFDDDGRPIEYQSVGRDITERKEAEEALAALTAELEARVEERTADLEAFTYSVSHDLRAPLRAIDGYTALLELEYRAELSDMAVGLLDRIGQNARQMARLIDDLLAFSRAGRQTLAVREVDPGQLVDEVFDALATERAGRDVEVFVGGLPTCRADPALLKQVFANVIGNALKFTRTRECARIEVGSFEQDGNVVYSVRDNGIGFDQRHVAELFQVFSRLQSVPEFEGTGVGLALVRRIVERHGGRVWAEGEVDRGATVFFTLGG
jgi:PAS domain S-box-containing protein